MFRENPLTDLHLCLSLIILAYPYIVKCPPFRKHELYQFCVARASVELVMFFAFILNVVWYFLKLYLYFFTYLFERDRDSTSGGRTKREGKRESQAGSGLRLTKPWDHDLSQTENQMLTLLSHQVPLSVVWYFLIELCMCSLNKPSMSKPHYFSV